MLNFYFPFPTSHSPILPPPVPQSKAKERQNRILHSIRIPVSKYMRLSHVISWADFLYVWREIKKEERKKINGEIMKKLHLSLRPEGELRGEENVPLSLVLSRRFLRNSREKKRTKRDGEKEYAHPDGDRFFGRTQT